MSNRLPNDTRRCYGYMCPQKEACKRFLTITLDEAIEAQRRSPVLFSYASSIVGSNDELECESFIQGEA